MIVGHRRETSAIAARRSNGKRSAIANFLNAPMPLRNIADCRKEALRQERIDLNDSSARWP